MSVRDVNLSIERQVGYARRACVGQESRLIERSLVRFGAGVTNEKSFVRWPSTAREDDAFVFEQSRAGPEADESGKHEPGARQEE